ncbi:hypothetical protein EMIHUDRAFT_205869 [Emiliania huxleyi CCMP1516]|uniref:AP2/ERF domain-containing protein n=2 Tax=Emiliania huxleyi TaxID=2903 RepID=A0A0D3JQH3_EMIH1|nr:hypothetical protein EMIHUDRAFT_205869 [Emiliania huxleyi CCMP1516]EOD25758.1 hypothetical protein EMIHUDRAFT_205869 [Emiliania huxleyi CCMP1516]|eukprot:XP_005778187.1 hypothetical protein EMIHUDRAFT_205869 [Emiliania huxleyi CCMP1516]
MPAAATAGRHWWEVPWRRPPAEQQSKRSHRRSRKGSIFRGVSRTWDGRWQAEIKEGGVVRPLGLFDGEEAAARAYDAEKLRLGHERWCKQQQLQLKQRQRPPPLPLPPRRGDGAGGEGQAAAEIEALQQRYKDTHQGRPPTGPFARDPAWLRGMIEGEPRQRDIGEMRGSAPGTRGACGAQGTPESIWVSQRHVALERDDALSGEVEAAAVESGLSSGLVRRLRCVLGREPGSFELQAERARLGAVPLQWRHQLRWLGLWLKLWDTHRLAVQQMLRGVGSAVRECVPAGADAAVARRAEEMLARFEAELRDAELVFVMAPAEQVAQGLSLEVLRASRANSAFCGACVACRESDAFRAPGRDGNSRKRPLRECERAAAVRRKQEELDRRGRRPGYVAEPRNYRTKRKRREEAAAAAEKGRACRRFARKRRRAAQRGEGREAEGLQLHLSSESSTGYKRVAKLPSGRFRAKHTVGGTLVNIGTFDTAVEAAAAYARSVGEPPERRTSGAAGQLPVAPPPVPAGGKGRPPPGSACAICHEKKLRCVRLPGGSCEYCVSNGLTCVRRGSSGGNCNPLKLELIEGDATLQALLVRTAGETGARTRDLLCAEGYHVTRKDVLNYRRTRKCARDAQAQREPERVSQP